MFVFLFTKMYKKSGAIFRSLRFHYIFIFFCITASSRLDDFIVSYTICLLIYRDSYRIYIIHTPYRVQSPGRLEVVLEVVLEVLKVILLLSPLSRVLAK